MMLHLLECPLLPESCSPDDLAMYTTPVPAVVCCSGGESVVTGEEEVIHQRTCKGSYKWIGEQQPTGCKSAKFVERIQ